jgi:DNA-binding NtrC family response regulator
MNESHHTRPVILIADDEIMVRRIAVAMLEGQDCIVVTAEDGEGAVRLVNDFPGEIALVLCDIRMPGPSGLQLREIILNKRPATKVVLLSGDTSFSTIPADVPTFPKPFTVQQFRRFVREMVGDIR